MNMENTHDIYLIAEIAADSQTKRRLAREQARWRKDLYQFGRDRNSFDELDSVSSVAFLGYN
ncbi:MAG: hypothetical protein ACU84Q_10090 [Gammaproteobacteria bacterium]